MQFTLKTLLLMVAMVAIPLAWLGPKLNQARQQRESLTAARSVGARTLYEQEVQWREGRYEDTGPATTEPHGPEWLRRILGRDFFDPVVHIIFQDGRTSDNDLELLKGLPETRSLSLTRTSVTDKGMALLSRLTGLEELFLDGTGITDAGLLQLSGLQHLKSLYLGGTGITDEGAKVISELRELRILCLEETQVSDAGLASLATLPHLEEVHVFKTGVSGDGAQAFTAARPSVRVIRTRVCPLHRYGRGMMIAVCPRSPTRRNS